MRPAPQGYQEEIHVTSSSSYGLGSGVNLAEMIGHKRVDVLQSQVGGFSGLLRQLEVSVGYQNDYSDNAVRAALQQREVGVLDTSVPVRKQRHGENVLPRPEKDSIWHFIVESIKDDRVVQILIGAAFLSIVLGMTTPDFRTGEVDFTTGWIEGAAIFISVFIVTGVNAINDFRKQEQFAQVMREEDAGRRAVTAWRCTGGSPSSSCRQRSFQALEVPSSDVVVGDVVQISSGMELNFDAILLSSVGSVIVDEGSVTGENDEVLKQISPDPFLISGSSVLDGSAEGMAVVCAVGEKSFSGEIAMSIQNTEKANTPLQDQLESMADIIGKFGVVAAVVTFVSLLLKEVYMYMMYGSRFYVMKFFENLTTAIAIVVVAVPEGLPLSVTISLAYSMRLMLKDGNLVRHLAACETMGGATVLCTDKTGTLTMPTMRVRQFHVDGETHLAQVGNISQPASSTLPPMTLQLLRDGLLCNAMEPEVGRATNKTSEALLVFAQSTLQQRLNHQEDFRVVRGSMLTRMQEPSSCRRYPFSSQSKMSQCLFRFPSGQGNASAMTTRMLATGAAEVVLSRCTSYLNAQGAVAPMDDGVRARLENTLTQYTQEGLRVLCCAFKDYGSPVEPSLWSNTATGHTQAAAGADPTEESDMCMIAFVGIEEDVRAEVPRAIQRCVAAGVRVLMITGDASLTAINIAHRCGLLRSTNKGDLITMSPATRNTASVGFAQTASITFGAGSPHMGYYSGGPEFQEDVFLKNDTPPPPPLQSTSSARERSDSMATGMHLRRGFTPPGQDKRDQFGSSFTGGNHATTWLQTEPPVNASSADLIKEGYVMDGPTFRQLTDEDLVRNYMPRLRVLARATPLDKKRVVHLLRMLDQGAVIAMTGDGTNDAPALKMSDVGFAMNSGTDVAKRASDIVLLSNNFVGMVKATMWGRNVKDNIRKFLQFQLTVNLAACVISFLGALMNDQNMSPLKPVQLLWLNLIMDTLAALALATELPCEEKLLARPPEPKTTPIIVPSMWFHICCQSCFQLISQLFLLGYGRAFVSKRRAPTMPTSAVDAAVHAEFSEAHICLVFNTFVWMQIFNFFNARLLHRNEGFFENWMSSPVLLIIVTVIAVLQVMIVEWGGKFMSTVPLTPSEWCTCLIIASGSLAVGAMSRWYYAHHARSLVDCDGWSRGILIRALRIFTGKKMRN